MATSSVRSVEVDKYFPVPAGVIDVRQQNKEDGDWYYDESSRAQEGEVLQTPEIPLPSPPSTFTIYEQKVRTSGDGRSVVDVVLDFPDQPGVQNIDVRVTKV